MSINVSAILANIKSASKDKIDSFVDEVEALSQERVPVKTGQLKRSWFRNIENVSGADISVKFGYEVDYADVVDERTGFFTTSVSDAIRKMYDNQ